MALVAKWLVTALAFLAVAEIVPGIAIASFVTALVLALLWGLLGVFVKPVLLLLTLPINLLTLGLFTFILNGFLLWLLGGIVKGFEVEGFWTAVLAGLVFSVVTTLAHWALERSLRAARGA